MLEEGETIPEIDISFPAHQETSQADVPLAGNRHRVYPFTNIAAFYNLLRTLPVYVPY